MTAAGAAILLLQATVLVSQPPCTWTPEMLPTHQIQVMSFVSAQHKWVERLYRLKHQMLHSSFFYHKDGCTMCHALCHRDHLSHSDTKILKQKEKSHSHPVTEQLWQHCKVTLTRSLQEHSTSIITVWFIHHKHKLQFYYAGSNIKEFNIVLLEIRNWWK